MARQGSVPKSWSLTVQLTGIHKTCLLAGLASVATLPYAWRSFASPVESLWFNCWPLLASLTVILVCTRAFRRPRRYHRNLLFIAVSVLAAFILWDLFWFYGAELPAIAAHPLADELLQGYELRVGVLVSGLACLVASLYFAARAKWPNP